MPKTANLQIKNEGISLLKKQRETTRIINSKYSMDLNPSTVLRWKKQEESILKNIAITKNAKKTINCTNESQLDFETELHDRCMNAFSREVRLYSYTIKNNARELQKEGKHSNFKCETNFECDLEKNG